MKKTKIEVEVDTARQDIRTDGFAMSIGEWISLYESGDLDIHPEFQRFYRWSDQQKSDLIESILLGIPLPPIFVSQRDNGVWDVIDGLQRLSTIFQFVGILKKDDGSIEKPLKLKKTLYLPSLEGLSWASEEEDGSLPVELQRVFKRSKINVSIVLRESDEKTKYDLFQRLNTGGSQLSAQEVRNCILVMVNSDFYEWIKSLSSNQFFIETTALSDRPLAEAYDVELVLRYLILSEISDDELSNFGDLGVFLDSRMLEIANNANFDRATWQKRFVDTFGKLAEDLGSNAFKRYSVQKGRHEGGFLVSQFEAVACGVDWNLHRGHLRNDLPAAVAQLWENAEFTAWAASGVTASRRLKKTIPFARNHFRNEDTNN